MKKVIVHYDPETNYLYGLDGTTIWASPTKDMFKDIELDQAPAVNYEARAKLITDLISRGVSPDDIVKLKAAGIV